MVRKIIKNKKRIFDVQPSQSFLYKNIKMLFIMVRIKLCKQKTQNRVSKIIELENNLGKS